MAKKKKKTGSDQISTLIRDLETALRRLRADIRKRATAAGMPRSLQAAADQLRRRAAMIAAQIEKRVHQIRKEIERGQRKPAKRAKKKTRAKRAKPRVAKAKPTAAPPPPPF